MNQKYHFTKEHRRAAIRLYAVKGWSTHRIAKVGKCSRSAVERVLHQMRGYRPRAEINRLRIGRKILSGMNDPHQIARDLKLCAPTVIKHLEEINA